MKQPNIKKMGIAKLEKERTSAKGFAEQYSKAAQQAHTPSEREENSRIASEYMTLAGDITRELAIRDMMKGAR